MDELKCSFCFDILIDCESVITHNCACKVKYHNDCLKQLNDNGWDCPICRKKNNNYNKLKHNGEFTDYIFTSFISNPTIETFTLFFLMSIMITFMYVIPCILYQIILTYIKFQFHDIKLKLNNIKLKLSDYIYKTTT